MKWAENPAIYRTADVLEAAKDADVLYTTCGAPWVRKLRRKRKRSLSVIR